MNNLAKIIQLEHFSVTDEPMDLLSDEAQQAVEQWRYIVHNPKPNTTAALRALVEKYPEHPVFLNYLSVAYQNLGNVKMATQTLEETHERYPDYLFARTALASRAIEKDNFERMFELLGKDLELHLLYPGKDLFHITEFKSYYATVAGYCLKTKDFDRLDRIFRMLIIVVPEEEVTKDMGRVILVNQVVKARARALALETIRKTARADLLQYPQRTEAPTFQHPEVAAIYGYKEEMPKSAMDEIMALPRPTLIADLIALLSDSMYRYNYFLHENTILSHHFAEDALYFLGALQAEEALDTILDFCSHGEVFEEFWLGEGFRSFPYILNAVAWNQLPKLEAFVRAPRKHPTVKAMLVLSVLQLGLHRPEQRETCLDWLKKMAEYLTDNVENPDIFDSHLFVNVHEAMIELCDQTCLPLIEKACHLDAYTKDFLGDFEKIVSELEKPIEPWQLDPQPANIYEWYNDEHLNRYVEDFNHPEDTEYLEYMSNLLQETANERSKIIPERKPVYKQAPAPLPVPKKNPYANVSQNAPCPCGSGKLFKRCHGIKR